MLCKKCNQPIEEQDMFCVHCGEANENLEQGTVNENEQEDSVKAMEEDTLANQEALLSTDQDEVKTVPQETKNKKKPMLFIALGAVIIALLGAITVLGSEMIFGGNKAFGDKLVSAYYNTFVSSKQMEASGSLRFDEVVFDDSAYYAEESEVIADVFKQVTMQYKMLKDLDQDKYQFDFGFLIKDSEFIDAKVVIERDKIYISIPKLYDKQFVFTWEDLGNELVFIDLQTYIDYLFAIKDLEEFKNIDFKAILKDIKPNYVVKEKVSETILGEEFSGDVYSIDYVALTDIIVTVFDTMIKDETVITFVDRIANDLADLLIETGDYYMMDLEEEDVLVFKGAGNELREMTGLSLKDVFAEELDMMNTNATYDVFLKNNQVAAFKTIISGVGDSEIGIQISSVGETVVHSVNKPVSFMAFDKEAIDLINADYAVMEEVSIDIQQNLLQIIFSTPAIGEIMSEFLY